MVQLLDLKARYSFAHGVMSSIIKCCSKFNVYEIKDKAINKNIVSHICPRYNDIEIWEYVVTCVANNEFITDWIMELKQKLYKVDKDNGNTTDINKIIDDIEKFLTGGDPNQTN